MAHMTQASAPVGTVATLGHPANRQLIVKADGTTDNGRGYWRYLATGHVVDDEDFRAGWDVYTPGPVLTWTPAASGVSSASAPLRDGWTAEVYAAPSGDRYRHRIVNPEGETMVMGSGFLTPERALEDLMETVTTLGLLPAQVNR